MLLRVTYPQTSLARLDVTFISSFQFLEVRFNSHREWKCDILHPFDWTQVAFFFSLIFTHSSKKLQKYAGHSMNIEEFQIV